MMSTELSRRDEVVWKSLPHLWKLVDRSEKVIWKLSSTRSAFAENEEREEKKH